MKTSNLINSISRSNEDGYDEDEDHELEGDGSFFLVT